MNGIEMGEAVVRQVGQVIREVGYQGRILVSLPEGATEAEQTYALARVRELLPTLDVTLTDGTIAVDRRGAGVGVLAAEEHLTRERGLIQ